MEQKRIAASIKKVALSLDVHPRTVSRMLRDGRLKAIRVGRRVMVCLKSLEKYCKEQN